MKKLLYFFFLFAYIALAKNAFGQKGGDFPTDPKQFSEALKKAFNDDKRAESISVLNKFLEGWDKGAYTATEQGQIIEFANFMRKEKLKINSDFVPYLNMLLAYKAGKVEEKKLGNYITVAKQVITKQKKDFKDITRAAETLFGEMSIYKDEAKNWKISNSNYTFEFKNDVPVIVFPMVELQLFTREDTMSIFQTSGEYFPTTEKWNGKNGNVYWTRVGFGKDKAVGKLKRYNLNVKSSDYAADSVEFSFPKIFKHPIMGKLQDKATTDFLGAKASYPRFQSYQAIFEIKNIFQNIDYKGGFALEGPQILGTGIDSNKATVTIKYNNKIALKATSKTFVIEPEKIVSSKATVAIYLGTDSVYHAQLVFNYLEKKRLLTLSRENIGLSSSPFFSTFHKLEFKTGNLLWRIDEPLIEMKDIVNPDIASTFSSANYYNEGDYIRAQGLLDYNPLKKLTQLVLRKKSNILTEDDITSHFNNKIEYLNNLLFQLANDGYIFYDVDGKRVIVKDKLMHYVNAAEKSNDFDIIKFESIISAKPNGTISLLSNEMKLEGVARINLSDSQNTFIVPTDQVVTIKKNRDMTFAGHVHSGRFDFYGKDFLFNYTRFHVVLSDVDSVKFKFPEYDKNGRVTGMRTIQNTIQDVNGFLYIDEQNNKSGKKMLEDYPIFECNKESYVYYDKPYIFKGVYNRNSFFFKINPFTIKNLDKFTAEGLRFPGSFTSADIIPVIKNDLTIQEDFSLGFIQTSPAAGYQMYKGKGTGKGTFYLSNKGFRANGEIDYLVSKTYAENFLLFPDSMQSQSREFSIPQIAGGKYPPVNGKGVANLWKPYKDSMYVFKGKEPISVYNGKIDFSGNLILTPVELVGTGKMSYQNLDLSSKAFAFLPGNIKTKSGNMTIKGVGSDKVALKADDVMADFDLNKDFGKFRSNNDTSQIDLPSNRFATTLNSFTYDLNKKEVAFTTNENQKDDDAYFVSRNPEKMGLKFMSKKATFSIAELNVTAQDVPYLPIADSRIYTPKNEVIIEKTGDIATIKNAKIVTSEKNQYHNIYNALVNVFSQQKFTGYGNMDYVDRNGKKFKMFLSDIRTTDDGKTVGKGTITDSTNMYLSPGLKYNGNVAFTSDRKVLSFEGFALAEHGNKQLRTEYVRFADTINPNHVVINIPEPKARDQKDLFTGVYMSNDSNKVYNLLFGRKINYNDLPILEVKGSLYYDDQAAEFRVGPLAKIKPDGDVAVGEGSVFRYAVNKKTVTTEGVYNFGAEYKHVELQTAGGYTYNYGDTTHKFELVMMLNFPMSEDAGKIMADTLVENTFENADAENTRPIVSNAFAMLVKDKKQKEKIINEIALNGFIPVTDEINKTFVFTDVQLAYNDTSKSFYSTGPITLATVMKAPVNKQLKGIIEMKKMRSGDKFYMLLESEPGSYHYFAYVNDLLSYLSSDFTFTDKVAETAPKVEKAAKGGYRMKLATVREVVNFRKKNKKR